MRENRAQTSKQGIVHKARAFSEVNGGAEPADDSGATYIAFALPEDSVEKSER